MGFGSDGAAVMTFLAPLELACILASFCSDLRSVDGCKPNVFAVFYLLPHSW